MRDHCGVSWWAESYVYGMDLLMYHHNFLIKLANKDRVN